MSSDLERKTRAPWLDALALAAGFLALYTVLGQWSWYKIDGQITILRMAEGGPGHPRHLLADEILRAFLGLVRPLDLSVYEGVRAFSALCAALAGICVHRSASRLGLSRLRCAAAQVAMGATPSLLFYATIVEFHAPFLFFAALAFWAATTWTTASMSLRCIGAMLVVGLLSGFAYLQHASGQVLPALLLPWIVVLARSRTGSWASGLMQAGCVGVLHFVVAKGLPLVIRRYELLPKFAPVAPTDAGAWSYVSWHFDTMSWGELRHVPTTLLFEWILPFACVSVLAWIGSKRMPRGTRRALAVALLPYLAISFLLMRHENEFGAYAIPCALLASIATAAALPPRFVLLLATAALVGGIINVRTHDQQSDGREWMQRLEAAGLHEHVILIVHDDRDRDAALMALPHRDVCQVHRVELLAAAAPDVAWKWITEQRNAGRRVLVTPGAWTRIDAEKLHADILVGRPAPELPGSGMRWLELR